MFQNDWDVTPRTYSIKSYRKKDSSSFKKVFKYLLYIMILVVLSGITFLSMNHVI